MSRGMYSCSIQRGQYLNAIQIYFTSWRRCWREWVMDLIRRRTGNCADWLFGLFDGESISKIMLPSKVVPCTFSGFRRRSHTVPLSALRSFLRAKVPLPRERNAKISRIPKIRESSQRWRGVWIRQPKRKVSWWTDFMTNPKARNRFRKCQR